MAFSLRKFTNLLNESKVPEIAKPEAPLNVVSFLRQLPVWRLGQARFCSHVSGGTPPRQAVQDLFARASVVLFVPLSTVARLKAPELRENDPATMWE